MKPNKVKILTISDQSIESFFELINQFDDRKSIEVRWASEDDLPDDFRVLAVDTNDTNRQVNRAIDVAIYSEHFEGISPGNSIPSISGIFGRRVPRAVKNKKIATMPNDRFKVIGIPYDLFVQAVFVANRDCFKTNKLLIPDFGFKVPFQVDSRNFDINFRCRVFTMIAKSNGFPVVDNQSPETFQHHIWDGKYTEVPIYPHDTAREICGKPW